MIDSKTKWMLRILGIVVVAAFILFAVLKFCGLLSWSWWWISAPVWGSALFFLVMLGIFALIALCFALAMGSTKKGGSDEIL